MRLDRVLCAVRGALRAPFAVLLPLLLRLGVRREGAVAVLFGLAAIPVILGAGIAIDTARAYLIKTRLASALDAAALAVGSEANTQNTNTLTQELKNYFYANYCKGVTGTTLSSCLSTVAEETSVNVTPSTNISSPTVTYTATATVPTTFMRIAGINNVSVTVTAQTTKFPGMEIAVVLDNTGSMLCGPNDGAPNYSDSLCGTGVITSNTTCDPASTDQSRICTLRNAAKAFVTTLVNAITAPQSLYMSLVPYVTTVNVGDNSNYSGTNTGLCSGSTTCSSITMTGSAFTGLRGNIVPTIPIQGNTSAGNSTVSNVQIYCSGSECPGGVSAYQALNATTTATLLVGMPIYGPGIPLGAAISSVSGTSVSFTCSPACASGATVTRTGAHLIVGQPATTTGVVRSTSVLAATRQVSPTTATGTTTNLLPLVTGISPSTTGAVVAGMAVSAASGIPAGDTVLLVVSGTQITLASNATASGSRTLTFSLKGNVSSGSASVTSIPSTTIPTAAGGIVAGMLVTDSAGRIPAGTYVLTVNSSTQITLSANATGTTSGDVLTFTSQGGNTTSASTSVSNVFLPSVPTVGMVISGNGISPNTTITAASSTAAQYAAGTGTLTISQSATATNNTELTLISPVTYDSAFNTTTPLGSSQTTNWGGCIVEPTSTAENSSNTGVLASATATPDSTEPGGGWPSWYPFYWHKQNVALTSTTLPNNWTPGAAAQQDVNHLNLGAVVSQYDGKAGPNQGCPVPILPLTDLTTSAGQTTVQNAIGAMWPRDSGGTEVHEGMIWGWRMLSPNTPYTANQATTGHPLAYDTAQTTGWKKIVVLMTDGSEEFPMTTDYTGFGGLPDGKLLTTSSTTTATTTLDSRLQTLCNNMKAHTTNGTTDYIIYTIGLGTDGAANTNLQNCAGPSPGFFSAATTSNINTVFQNIAASIIQLRLTQ